MSISYQYRTYIATFLPFRAYSIDNQLIIDTQVESNASLPILGQNAPRETLILGQQKKARSPICAQEGKSTDFKLEQYANAYFPTLLHLDKPSIDDKLVQYWKEASPIVVQEGKST